MFCIFSPWNRNFSRAKQCWKCFPAHSGREGGNRKEIYVQMCGGKYWLHPMAKLQRNQFYKLYSNQILCYTLFLFVFVCLFACFINQSLKLMLKWKRQPVFFPQKTEGIVKPKGQNKSKQTNRTDQKRTEQNRTKQKTTKPNKNKNKQANK